MSEDRKNEPPFGLSMGFGEALERFALVKPTEIQTEPKRNKNSKRRKASSLLLGVQIKKGDDNTKP